MPLKQGDLKFQLSSLVVLERWWSHAAVPLEVACMKVHCSGGRPVATNGNLPMVFEPWAHHRLRAVHATASSCFQSFVPV